MPHIMPLRAAATALRCHGLHYRAAWVPNLTAGSLYLDSRRLPHQACSFQSSASYSSSPAIDMDVFDEDQVKMMEEMCILVDQDDAVVCGDTKKNVHLIDGPCMKPGGIPHRAFSLFLFNQKNELLMQQVRSPQVPPASVYFMYGSLMCATYWQRCDQKILFPDHWANTCCSHPLHDGAPRRTSLPAVSCCVHFRFLRGHHYALRLSLLPWIRRALPG